nr:glycosyltransferase [Cytophagales bacterium]
MKIIYIHQYFFTPEEGGAIRSYHLAKGMVDAGIDVEMVTAHDAGNYDIKVIEGIKVHYLPVAYDNSYGFFRRAVSFVKFVLAAKRVIKKLPRPDYLYITSTPLTTGIIGRWAKRKFAVPFVFEVRDLWPEAPVQMGVVKNKILTKFLYRLERLIYSDATHLVALSPGIFQSIRETCPAKPISLIPNFSDPEFFDPAVNDSANETKQLANDQPIISYIGAIGPVNGLEAFVALAQAAKVRGLAYQFVLMGKGVGLAEIERQKELLGLDNLYLKPFDDKYAVRQLLANTDFVYLSFRPYPVLTTSSPNKFFDAIAMGKPIILNFKGWIHDIVVDAKLGVYHDSVDISPVFDYIQQVKENPKSIAGICERGRRLACNQYSKRRAIEALLRIFKEKKGKRKKANAAYIRIA